VPEKGVQSSVTPEELSQNMDPKTAPKPKSASIETPRVFQRVASR
jgi:hypothetical protein